MDPLQFVFDRFKKQKIPKDLETTLRTGKVEKKKEQNQGKAVGWGKRRGGRKRMSEISIWLGSC